MCRPFLRETEWFCLLPNSCGTAGVLISALVKQLPPYWKVVLVASESPSVEQSDAHTGVSQLNWSVFARRQVSTLFTSPRITLVSAEQLLHSVNPRRTLVLRNRNMKLTALEVIVWYKGSWSLIEEFYISVPMPFLAVVLGEVQTWQLQDPH